MSSRSIEGAIAFVTGANRGIGRATVTALLNRGAAKVYAAARNPDAVDDLRARFGDRVVPLALDVTDAGQVEAAATNHDVTLLFNNAGVAAASPGARLDEQDLDPARTEMDVNYFGTLRLTQRFAPILGKNGGGAVVNVVSVAGLASFPLFWSYSASKAALHSLTQATRLQLASQGTTVFGVYPGPVDTDMAKDVPMDKASPGDVADAILDGVEAGTEDIFPDPVAEAMGTQYENSPKGLETQVAAMVS